MYSENLAETPNRILHRQLTDNGALQPGSFAKYAAAFFKMSRSSSLAGVQHANDAIRPADRTIAATFRGACCSA